MIVAVTGSTRSGSTLMMRMLHVGGIPAYADNLYSFESDKALRLPDDTSWISEAEGHAVKILEPLHYKPPTGFDWRFVFMHRDPIEQAKSQVKFARLVGGIDLDLGAYKPLAASIRADIPKMRSMLAQRGKVLEVSFTLLIERPAMVAQIVQNFLGVPINTEAMAAEVIPRSPRCLPGLLELDFREPRAVSVAR